ncbi:MAG: hypothetical protein ACKVU1_14575 [bacterium]
MLGPVFRSAGGVALIGLALALAAAAPGAACAQSRFDERARAYMLEHCMEETVKRIEPGTMITVTLASGDMLRGSFVRATAETLVVYPKGLANRGGEQLPLEKPRIRSLRFDNKPHRSLATGLLGFAIGYVAGVGVSAIALDATDRGILGVWPIVVGAALAGSTAGFFIGYGYPMKHPGESLIQCQ